MSLRQASFEAICALQDRLVDWLADEDDDDDNNDNSDTTETNESGGAACIMRRGRGSTPPKDGSGVRRGSLVSVVMVRDVSRRIILRGCAGRPVCMFA